MFGYCWWNRYEVDFSWYNTKEELMKRLQEEYAACYAFDDGESLSEWVDNNLMICIRYTYDEIENYF